MLLKLKSNRSHRLSLQYILGQGAPEPQGSYFKSSARLIVPSLEQIQGWQSASSVILMRNEVKVKG